MTRYLRSALLSTATLCALAATASAQNEPPPAASPPSSSMSRSGGSHGPIGFGGIAYLGGTAGLSVAFDPGPWHLDTLLAFSGGDGQNSVMQFGGRFWYHLHSVGAADFSVGAGVSALRVNPPGAAPSATGLFFEGGGLIRIFLASNVALGLATGISIGTNDADEYSFGATNFVGNASIHYYF